MVIKIIIVGAGAGGIATAARLSKKGFQVDVYEKNSYNGGRCSLIYKNGHRFDQGPSLYLMPKIFEETFQDLNEDINDHIELLKCPSNYNLYFPDGEIIQLSTDLSKLSKCLKKYENNGEELSRINLSNFLKESRVHYQKCVKLALKTDFQNWYNLFNPIFFSNLLQVKFWDTVYTRACKYFKSDYVRQAFTFQTMYLG